MSLLAFQQAMCDLIASPDLCRRMRQDPDAILTQYELSARERRRLVSIIWQRGMSTNCALYRANRITPIYSALPLTCFLLGDLLLPETELYWRTTERVDLQFSEESRRFAAFLLARLRTGAVTGGHLEEVLAFELATIDLRFALRAGNGHISRDSPTLSQAALRLHPLVRIVRFRHDPALLLDHITKMHRPPYDLPAAEFYVLLDARGDTLEIQRIDPQLGNLLAGFENHCAPPLAPDDLSTLVEADLLVASKGTQPRIKL